MQAVTTIGLDIAKSVFQVHCVDAAGQLVIRQQLKRRYVADVLPEVAALTESASLVRHRTIGRASVRRSGQCA
jgi:hypothetical protein